MGRGPQRPRSTKAMMNRRAPSRFSWRTIDNERADRGSLRGEFRHARERSRNRGRLAALDGGPAAAAGPRNGGSVQGTMDRDQRELGGEARQRRIGPAGFPAFGRKVSAEFSPYGRYSPAAPVGKRVGDREQSYTETDVAEYCWRR